MKREVLFEGAKRLAEINDAISTTFAAIQLGLMEQQAAGVDRLSHVLTGLGQTIHLVRIVCDENETAFKIVESKVYEWAKVLPTKEDIAVYRRDLSACMAAAQATMRKELGIEEQE